MDFNKLATISLLCLFSIIGCEPQPSQTAHPKNVESNQVTTDKKSSNYICAHLLVKSDLVADNLTLTIEDKSYQLSQTESASGSKYISQNKAVTFWQKGDSASLEINGQRYNNCEKVTVQQATASLNSIELPFTAIGNEPGWMLDLSAQQLELTTDYGQTTITQSLSKPLIIDPGSPTQIDTELGMLTFTVEDKLCHDSMSGMPYPYSVSLQLEQSNYTGCGGEPGSLLSNNSWALLTLSDQMLTQGSRISLKFNGDMQLAGVASCNRYTTSYNLTGEGLTIGTITTTLMACDPALMEQEANFLKHLANVVRFDISDSGQLTLYTNNGATLVAKPENS